MNIRGTTIIAVRRNGKITMAGDGQVTMGERYVAKATAVKVRRIYEGKVVIGFAGATADAFNLSEKFEKMLRKYSGNLTRAAVELAQLWRNDKILKNPWSNGTAKKQKKHQKPSNTYDKIDIIFNT